MQKIESKMHVDKKNIDKYAIVSDVTMDLPQDIINKMGIEVLPMKFELGNTIYTHYTDKIPSFSCL